MMFHLKLYNLKEITTEKINDALIQCKEGLTTSVNIELQNNNIEAGIDILDAKLADIHKANKIKPLKVSHQISTKMEDANKAFDEYMRTIDDPKSTNEVINEKLERYKFARKALTKDVVSAETKKWNDVIQGNDSKRYWSFIDWKGNVKHKKQLTSPALHEFELFFEDLYKCNNPAELYEIMNLQSDVHVPVLDEPFTENEVQVAFRNMKNSGYDYKLPVLKTLVASFSLLLVTILNMIFFVKYPVSLACSLLSLIPKTGNLLLPKNYRGIQMMKALACLYDHIIANRLKLWLSFNVNQTAFQKNKSTLLHIFTLRILIEVAKKKKLPLYIGTMDIEKAFDHIPRSLLLKKLVTLGIGKCMLFALKQVYCFSVCVLKFQGDLSRSFSMERGVRQGAASSVLLFNAFIDGLFNHLEAKCSTEELLSNPHSLIHADDTIILSTDRKQFIHKCNEAIAFFTENKLNLNMGKSCYLVINSNSTAHSKTNIVLKSGLLKYKNCFKYLGIIISDSGSLKQDVKSIVDRKRSNVSIKFTNFCKVNRNAPLNVKLDVLDICVASSIIYASETWGNNSKEADLCYRSGLKTALSVRKNTNNEIIYIETGKFPLHCRIQKLQIKFWLYVVRYIAEFPDSALSKVVKIGLDNSIPYLRYYQNLVLKFDNPFRCEQTLNKSYTDLWKQKIVEASIDVDCKLGTYYTVSTLSYKSSHQILKI